MQVQTNGDVSAPQTVIDACGELTEKLKKIAVSLVAQAQLIRGVTLGNGQVQMY